MAIEDNASIALIPSGYKSGKLYSVIPESGNGDFTHSRSNTTATRVAASGLIENVSSNVPRLDYPLIDGVVQDCPALLLEPSRTNVLPYSEEMNNSGWNKSNSTITANQIVSPDGSQTADKYTHGGSTAANYIFESGFSVSSGTEYTFSVFVKKGTTDFVQLLLSSGMFGTLHQNFDINNGVIGSRSGNPEPFIEEYPNDWFRIGITDTANLTGTGSALISLARSNTENRIASFSSSQYFYLWGAQFETGGYKTSYIPTSGSIATRSADVCNGSGTSAEFNDSEGVLFVECSLLTNSGANTYLSIGDTTGTRDSVEFHFRTELNRIRGIIYSNGSVTVNISTYDFNKTNNNKIAFKYKDNDFAIWVNGTKAVTSSSGAAPLKLSNLRFEDANGGNDWYGKCKQLMTFKTALTDSELETLTSWDSFTAMAKGQLYTIE